MLNFNCLNRGLHGLSEPGFSGLPDLQDWKSLRRKVTA